MNSSQSPTTYSLFFDKTLYEDRQFDNGHGEIVSFRAFENIVYVTKPVDIKYQSMNIYVPQAYFEGKEINSFTAETAPIFFPISVGGYMPGRPGAPGAKRIGSGMNTIFHALAHGYVVAAPGTRGRTNQNYTGEYTGKAPACIVDLKAAVRYLRFNAERIPGDTDKIISNGTSAGGALSALLGASGNNEEYGTYLKEIGAAPVRDDIFAVSSYCPITNLEHADMAYEWLFNGQLDYKKMAHHEMIDFHLKRTLIKGTLNDSEASLSNQLKELFPAYLNSLNLQDIDGSPLTLDAKGNGSFKNLIANQIIASAQSAVDQGIDLSRHDWLTVQSGKITAIDLGGYISYIGRMKTPPAFDALDLSSGENNLFGSKTTPDRHFTDFSLHHSTATNAQKADDQVIRLLNPMNHIGASATTTAHYWRIRHGTKDRDTSLAIPIILATTLENKGCQIDFALPWNRAHGGDYDLDELFAWIDTISTS